MNAASPFAGAGTRPVSFTRMAVIGGLLVAIGPISLTLYAPAMPTIGADLGASAGAVKLTMTGYFLGFAIAQLVCGPLSDGFGRKPVLAGFMGAYVLGSLACSLAGGIETLIAARVLQGVGASAGIALTRAMVRDGFVGQESARLLNLIGICLALGPAVSPTLGAGLLQLFDWHSVFLVMLALGVGLTVIVVTSVPETSRVLLPSRARPSVIVGNFRQVLSNAGFWKACIIVGATLGGLYAFAAMMPFIVIETFGLTPIQFAMVMLLQTGGYLGTAIAMRRLLPLVGELKAAAAGVALIAVASCMFFVLRWLDGSLLLTIAPIPLWASGIAMLMPGSTTAALAPFPRTAGAASALLGFFQVGGGLAGSLAASLFTDHLMALATVIPVMGASAVLALVLLPWPAEAHGAAAGEHPGPQATLLDSDAQRT